MNMNDLILVILAYLYVFIIVAIGEFLRKKKGFHPMITRRLIHIFAGCIVIIVPLFSSFLWPMLVPLGLLFLVIYSFKSKSENPFKSSMVVSGDVVAHAYGPAYYIISILILVIIYGYLNKILAIIIPSYIMAWGDGIVPLLAPKLKKQHKYPWSQKSIEGSAIVFLFSLLGAIFSSFLYSLLTNTLFYPLIKICFIASLVGTIVDALTFGPLKHYDNFTIPLISSLVVAIMI
ncbi:MAG: hypothetical protein QXY18_06545 [Nitrososphaerota archaeon]